jgi:3-hydroxyisobutyrate dehydrogenase-like beta-hydroxyacid dehydrogenase
MAQASAAVAAADIVISVLESGPVVEAVLFTQGVAACDEAGRAFSGHGLHPAA